MFGRTSSMHSTFAHAKKRIDQMDAALAALERSARKSPTGRKAAQLLAAAKKHRSGFKASLSEMQAEARAAEQRIRQLSKASAASWSAFQLAAARSRKAFGVANRKASRAIRGAVK